MKSITRVLSCAVGLALLALALGACAPLTQDHTPALTSPPASDATQAITGRYHRNIEDFAADFNSFAQEEACKIGNWQADELPGIFRYTFDGGLRLTVGISPNEEHLVYIPEFSAKTLSCSEVPHFQALFYQMLKVGDPALTDSQIESALEKITLSEIEQKLAQYNPQLREVNAGNVKISAIYEQDHMYLSFTEEPNRADSTKSTF